MQHASRLATLTDAGGDASPHFPWIQPWAKRQTSLSWTMYTVCLKFNSLSGIRSAQFVAEWVCC